MKKISYLAMLLCAGCMFTACSEDDDEVKVKTVTVDFEGEYFNNLIDAEQYNGPLLYSAEKQYTWEDATTGLTGCVNGAADYYTGAFTYMFWNGGTAISNYVESNVADHTNYKEQLNVPASNGSKNFVVAYCNTEISFKDGNNHKVLSMDVCPTTYLLGAMLGHDGYAGSLEKTGNMTLTIEAYKFDEEKASASLDIDFARDGKIMKGWTRVDLTSLGEFNSLKFSMDGSDRSEYGVKHPQYFAFDNVVVEVK